MAEGGGRRKEAEPEPTGRRAPMAGRQQQAARGGDEGADSPPLPRPHLVPLRGVPMPDIFVEQWEEVEQFPARPSDVLIATYPKSGTTWVQEIVDMILHEGDSTQCRRAPLQIRIPFLECKQSGEPRLGLQMLLETLPPRMIKTHLPFQMLPPSFLEQGCKMIYCARNPKDVMVSYFHFDRMNLLQPHPGTWEEYFQRFCQGDVSYGAWYDHVRGWWEQRDRHPVLYLFYEDMQEDLKREVLKMTSFLGKSLPDSVVDAIVRHTSFESMKANPMCNYSSVPTSIFDTTASTFMRKGRVSDWKNHFTAEQDREFEEEYQRRMQQSGLNFRTEL